VSVCRLLKVGSGGRTARVARTGAGAGEKGFGEWRWISPTQTDHDLDSSPKPVNTNFHKAQGMWGQ
jgi:hypothetical protein